VCGHELAQIGGELRCAHCGRVIPMDGGIPRFVSSETHASFALEWKRFADVQLDSRNGTTESRDRLLAQSHLHPEDFADRRILEVGCGAGRFTEVLLAFGARVTAVDYSEAIEACAASNAAAITAGRLTVAQADVFALPFKDRAFDIVIGYGMLQHTGAPRRALARLWDKVVPGGALLVDRYQLDFRHFLPIKYALRPFTRTMQPEKLLGGVEKLCAALVPIERRLLRGAQSGGARRFIRYVLGRAPNSTYPLNLELRGLLARDVAFRWSVLDTFDQYSPRYDLPCTAAQWREQISALQEGQVEHIGSGGQGNVAVVRRLAGP